MRRITAVVLGVGLLMGTGAQAQAAAPETRAIDAQVVKQEFTVKNVEQGDPTPVRGKGTAYCSDGSTLTGGGYNLGDDGSDLVVTLNAPTDDGKGWTVEIVSTAPRQPNASLTATVYAVCQTQ
ncbi:hypothetical protein [Streptomyces sp. CS014]|uniref:hypothetical protein n=1 Tax=Streptomyces sp. CS014 TaxID=2162707 RepID=UPI000D5250E1|nr:hypothetical protein [Streptomyces sp. CS014]PVC81763.1 hypothetical protein DBP12_36565 [Streptomyces sp. CS014]